MKIHGLSLALKIAIILIGSWLLIHGLAFLGTFLALAYPIWWILAPKKTYCIACRAQKESGYCSFCKEPIKPRQLYPKNLRSAILNAITILFLSLFSIFVVYIESQIIQKVININTEKTVTFSINDKGQYKMGEIFSMDIEISGVQKPVNAIRADVQFDPKRLEVVNISTENSFADIFIQKEYDNEKGFARLTGGLPNPGYNGNKGLFGTIYFKSKKAGLTEVKFLPTSLVLANDGHGTNILKAPESALFLILPETISAYESKKQEVILKPLVLGTQTDKTKDQLHLYDTKTHDISSSVLGMQVEQLDENAKNADQTSGTQNQQANQSEKNTYKKTTRTKTKQLAQVTQDNQTEEQNILQKILTYLHKIDTFILSIWQIF